MEPVAPRKENHMTSPKPNHSAEITETSLARDILYAARYYLGDRRGLLILAGLALVTGAAFNWSWLVAAEIAPLLVTALPCVAMCALGLCMNKMGNKSCSSETTSAQDNDQGAGDHGTSNAEAPAPLPRALDNEEK